MPIIITDSTKTTTIPNLQKEILINGSPIGLVKVDGVYVWRREPVAVGYTAPTFSWANGSNIATFITTYAVTNSIAFATTPVFTAGSGAPDSIISFRLNSGWIVSSYTQAQFGTQTMATGLTGGTYSMGVGATVSGLSGTNITLPGSGNGGSSMIIKYIGN